MAERVHKLYRKSEVIPYPNTVPASKGKVAIQQQKPPEQTMGIDVARVDVNDVVPPPSAPSERRCGQLDGHHKSRRTNISLLYAAISCLIYIGTIGGLIWNNGITVDGGWSPYGPYSECTKTCGGGTKFRERSCTDPRPVNGGKFCKGASKDFQVCNSESCFMSTTTRGQGRWGVEEMED